MRRESDDPRAASGKEAMMGRLKISRTGDWKTATQSARIESAGLVELYLCARPSPDASGFADQARSMYNNLFDALVHHGAKPKNVITERVFFSDVDRQFRDLEKIRNHCYNGLLDVSEYLPATIFLHQPPSHTGRLCELQVYAAFAKGDDGPKVRTLEDLPGLASGKVVEYGGHHHIYLMNLTGGEGPGDGMDFTAQATDMFRRAQALLQREGASFSGVLRTWIYVNNMERDYAALNRVRTRFFRTNQVTRLPASTGIQGATYPRERGCAMDVYTVAGDPPVEAHVLHAPTMNEAPRYGSAFSRGMKVVGEDRITLYVSGTASIDTEGNVVHVGDFQGQARRMLVNVEQLLASQDAGFGDLVSAITYLKEPRFLDTFLEVCAERSFPADIPNAISVADICRPEWLCEIEGIAVRPKNG